MSQFVSVVLEYAVVLERKDRQVGNVMVAIMVNDQGSDPIYWREKQEEKAMGR